MTGTGMLPPQFVLSGRYVILRRVGKGGMGAVYQAADNRIAGKTWAVKEMSDAAITNPLEKQQAQDAFRQEAQLLSLLEHSNLPKVVDHFSEKGKQYLVMDFIQGETLEERMEQGQGESLSQEKVLAWGSQLCDVLDYLHSQNPPLIFRDLKPANVMVTSDDVVKLIDFGIARVFKVGKSTDTSYFGTAGYAPKEQFGKGQTDARSDVYALGATLHHLLTGADPADEPFHFEDIRQLNDRVSVEVADAVMKAVQYEPADRWQSVAEMKAALTQQTTKPRPQPKIAPPPQPAAAVAQVSTVAAPIPAPGVSRLTFWRGAWLVLLGSVLYGSGAWATNTFLKGLPVAPFVFIPSLFGVLFGPWVGGCVSVLGSLAWAVLGEQFDVVLWYLWWGILNALALGMLPGLMVKDARRWKTIVSTSILASGIYALGTALTIGVVYGYWEGFGEIAGQQLIANLFPSVLVLPIFVRWLAGPVQRRGLYWRDHH
jgi:serine/threonine-protein kinase